ncbi:MAG: Ig-like domain-containing protein, partial [Thermoplasmata archaeon]
FYATWNSTHIFFAWNGTNWAGEGDLHIYLNVSSGGSQTSKNWNGVHTLPFDADYLFWIEDSNQNNFGLDSFSTTWSPYSMNGVSQYIGWADNKNTEIAIPRSLIGNPTKIGVIAYALWENEGKAWNAFPVVNPATQTGSETFIAYYLFDLSTGISPNESPVINIQQQQNNMNADGSFADWLISYNETTAWDKFLISWNETYLFLGWNGTNWASSGDLMFYINTTNGGSSQTLDWSGIHTLPFQADYLFWIEDGNEGCYGLKKYENGWIQALYTGKAYIGWANNPNTEIFIPLSNLNINSVNSQTKIDILVFAQWENNCNVWRAYPQANPVYNSGQQAFTDHYSCNLQNSPTSISIISDSILPNVSILYPSNGEVIISSEYTIKASANDNIAIAKVEISIDGAAFQNMSWNSFENVYYYNWLGYSPGTHSITAKAKDAKGNEKTTSISVTYSPGGTDTVPPTVYIDYPTNNEIIQAENYEIKARAFDNVGITSMQVKIDNSAYYNMYYISQEGRWGYLWSGYSTGSHNITVKASDAAGNNCTQMVECFYDPNLADTTPPTVTIDYPTPGETITSSSYIVKARANDNTGINSVQIRIDAGNWQNMNWNSYELRWTFAWSDYTEGSHTLAVRAFDYAGNNATSTVSVNYIPSSIDNIKPVVYIDYPTPGEIIVSQSYEIKAHATDNIGVTLLQVAIDSGAWNNMWYDSYEDRWAFHWEYYSEGVHSITVRAFDAAGNNGSATVTCTYSTSSQDTTPPIVNIEYPSPGEVIVSSTYEIKVRANDNVGVVSVAISIDGSNYIDMLKLGEYYVYSWTNYNPGTHNITVKAWDAANNVGIAFAILTYTPSGDDTIPPQVFIESPTPNQIITMSGFPIRARVTDNVGVSTVKVRIDQSVWLDMSQSNGVWTYFWSTYTEGMHNISVRGTDFAGNNATATVSCFYYIDEEYPNIVILSHSDGQQVGTESITITGTSSDDIGIKSVEACLNPGNTCNWVNCSGTTFWVVKLTLSEGNNVIVIRATDLAGKSTNKTINIRLGTSITPDI